MDNVHRKKQAGKSGPLLMPGRGGMTAPYRATDRGIVRVTLTEQGFKEVALTNFVARIVTEIEFDDGNAVVREFEMEVTLDGIRQSIRVLAGEFSKMNWVLQQLGAHAIIFAGPGNRDHARTAIQFFSTKIRRQVVYGHTGWKQVNGRWCFLHANGAIDENGAAEGISVRLPDPLQGFVLPPPPGGGKLNVMIRGTLGLLNLGHKNIMYVLLAAIFRVPLGQTDFTIHLEGRTGTGKSELAALAQQHFGKGMDARHLPGNWSSTPNANESLAFAAKDVLYVVDDFIPNGSTLDVQHQHRDADRLLRGQGNGAGRQRLNSDSRLQPTKFSRALILSTGEDSPRGHSLRARMLTIEVAPKTINWPNLTQCQMRARNGVYAMTMAGYLKYLAPQYDAIQIRMKAEMAALRREASAVTSHRRTPDIAASLGVGWRHFLNFSVASGAINQEEANAYWTAGWQALIDAAQMQDPHQEGSDPAHRFITLVVAALSSGTAHVAGPTGNEPITPEAYGWRSFTVGVGENEREEWRGQGLRIGWIDGEDVFLEPDAAYKAAQGIARDLGESLTITVSVLRKRLHEQGMLAAIDISRKTLTVRKQLESQRREVLHIKVSTLFPGANQ
jgi:hypothetical protein